MFENRIHRHLFSALFATLTVSGMALFFNLYDPWEPIGPDRVVDGGFETAACLAEWTGWDSETARLDPEGGADGSAGAVLLSAEKRRGRLQLPIGRTENIPAFRVSAYASAKNVRGGAKIWDLPRGVFLYADRASGKPLYRGNHTLFAMDKDSAWRKFTAVFPVPENVQGGWVVLQNRGEAGILCTDNVSVIPVAPKTSAVRFNLLFTLLWILALAVCLATLRPWKKWSGAGALLCALVIIIGVILPGERLDSSIASATGNLKQLLPERQQPAQQLTPQKPVPKAATPSAIKQKPKPAVRPAGKSVQHAHTAGHFVLFALMTLFSMLCWAPVRKPALRILCVTGSLGLFAAATETLQFVTFDRKAGLNDLWTDFEGILLAATAITLLSLPLRIRKRLSARGSLTEK